MTDPAAALLRRVVNAQLAVDEECSRERRKRAS